MKRYRLLLLAIPFALFACNSSEKSEPTPESENPQMEDSMEDEDENERTISEADIPEIVLMALNTQASDFTITDADEITHEDGSITYDIEVESNGTTTEYMFGADGSYLGIEMDDEDEDEDGEEN